MTRILCFADTQIGVGTVELADQRKVLDQIVEHGLEADVVVHGGDVFEGPVVTPEQMRMFLDATEPLRKADIPVLILRGNGRHDSAVRSVHALDVLRDVPGFYVYDRPDSVVFGGVEIDVLPWVHPGTLIAQMNGSVDHDLVNTAVTDLLVRILRDLRLGEPAILVAHWAISGAALPSGLPVEEMREPILPWAELDAMGYAAIVGAHIHQPQNLGDPNLDKTPGFVVGSPQQLNFGEKGEHGCWGLDLTVQGEAVSEFIPLASRPFVTLDFDHEDALAQVALSDQIGWEIPEGALIRVRLNLSEVEAQRFDPLYLRRRLMDAGAHAVRLDIDIQRETRQRAVIDEQLGAEEVMALYCDAVGIDDRMRGHLLTTIKEWASE